MADPTQRHKAENALAVEPTVVASREQIDAICDRLGALEAKKASMALDLILQMARLLGRVLL